MQVEKAIVYAEREGFRALELDVYRPGASPAGARPLIVYVHGWPRRVRNSSTPLYR